MEISIYASIITLNVNGLNAPIKKHRMVNAFKKNKTHIYAVNKRHTSDLETHKD